MESFKIQNQAVIDRFGSEITDANAEAQQQWRQILDTRIADAVREIERRVAGSDRSAQDNVRESVEDYLKKMKKTCRMQLLCLELASCPPEVIHTARVKLHGVTQAMLPLRMASQGETLALARQSVLTTATDTTRIQSALRVMLCSLADSDKSSLQDLIQDYDFKTRLCEGLVSSLEGDKWANLRDKVMADYIEERDETLKRFRDRNTEGNTRVSAKFSNICIKCVLLKYAERSANAGLFHRSGDSDCED